jgi:hypothetical protein
LYFETHFQQVMAKKAYAPEVQAEVQEVSTIEDMWVSTHITFTIPHLRRAAEQRPGESWKHASAYRQRLHNGAAHFATCAQDVQSWRPAVIITEVDSAGGVRCED